MTPDASAFLLQRAPKYIWWKTPEEAMEYPDKIIAQIMDIGDWEDTCELLERVGQDELKRILSVAQAGWLRPRSWHYWHYRLFGPETIVPPVPVRSFS